MALKAGAMVDLSSFSGDKMLSYLKTSVFALDSRWCVQYMNHSAEVLTGTTLHRVRSLNLEELFDQSQQVIELCEHANTINGSVEMREIELVSLHNPQKTLFVDVTAVPMEKRGVLLEISDITNTMRIKRDKAMRSQNTVSRTIIKQLAHEIKNPLGGLRGAAQLLSRRLPSPDLLEYTDVIINETDRLVELVDAMLGPTRPTHRKMGNPHRILDHVGKLIESEANDQIEIIRDYDPSLPDILIDDDQLTQAVLNLARNALSAVGDTGVITLRSRIEAGVTLGQTRHNMVVRIDVADDGPGVPEALREQIFYPLVTGRVDGVGLGLAISQELVNRHNGLIKLQMGEPTTFSIYLPMVDAREES